MTVRYTSRFHHFAILAAAGVAALLLGACRHGPYVWVDKLPDESYEPRPYRIRSGDDIRVQIWNQEQLSTDARVRPDGRITVALVGDVAIAGLTPTDAAGQIEQRLTKGGIVVDPRVSVAVREGHPDHITVLGEVQTAGRYPLERGETVLHVIAKAGGLTEFANGDELYVLRRDPEPVRVRFSYQELAGGVGRGLEFVLQDGDIIVVE